MGTGIYDYGYDTAITNWEELFSAIAAESAFNPFTLIMNLASYVLLAIGMYSIAKRRGINHAWLAWIPLLGRTWLLGCISDQYRYVARREEKNKRKAMLILEILELAACVVMIALVVMMLVDLFGTLGFDTDANLTPAAVTRLMGYAGWILVIAMVTLGLAIALAVLMYMSYYDLFASCDPNNKTIFLVLGIFFGIAMSIFVFACRKKDHGMPPRRDTMQPQMWTPPQQTWQPPQPPVEPWNQNQE